MMSPKVAIEPKTVEHDQPAVDRAIQTVAPREPAVDTVKARGLVSAKGNSPGALNLAAGTRATVRDQGDDARQATPAKSITKPSERHQEVHRPVRLHRPVQPASPGGASVSLRRAKVVLHGVPGDRLVDGKKTLRLRPAPKPAPSSGVIARPIPKASKLETERRRVVVHSIVRDLPGVGHKWVIALRLKPPGR